MPSVPGPPDPGWDEDPAWLDRDPVSPEDQEAWLDRLCELDDDPFYDPQEYWHPKPARRRRPGRATAEELAGIREAAAG